MGQTRKQTKGYRRETNVKELKSYKMCALTIMEPNWKSVTKTTGNS